MPLYEIVRALVVASLVLLADCHQPLNADETKVDWLRGSGKDLQICLKGEVFEADGRVASDLQITGRMNDGNLNRQLQPAIGRRS